MKKIICISFLFFFNVFIYGQKKVALYWDASFSMIERDVDRELNYLDNYFKKHQNIELSLIVFSNAIILKEKYQVIDGLWVKLRNDLENTIYDGATSYEVLFKDTADEFLIFSDGLDNLDVLQPPLNKPIHIVNSTKGNDKRLKLIADLSSGSYVKLNSENSSDKNISKKNTIVKVTGKVSDIDGPLKYATIINKNSNKVVNASFNGDYSIEAKSGDIFVFNAQGKKAVNIQIDKTNFLDIFMQNIDEALDEVVVNAKVEKEELVNTGNGYVDKRRLGYDTKTINKEDISELDTDLVGAVQGQFSNLILASRTDGKVDLTQFIGRHNSMTILGNQYGLVVIDGVPQATSNSARGGFIARTNNMIDPSIIKSITYLKGLAATNKYGTTGANGVILITTINGEGFSKKIKQKKIGTTATYDGKAKAIVGLANKSYISSIKDSRTIDEAYATYLALRKFNQENPYFYIDMYDYFSKWNNKTLSIKIISNVFETNTKNIAALRALAYKYEAINTKEAINVYKYILKKAPQQLQSYRDLILVYAEAGDFKNSDNISLKLKRHVNKTRASSFLNIINKELQCIKDKRLKNQKPSYGNAKTRLVFQWNNADTEFDLNIINPKKRFFTWSHSMQDASQQILDEKRQGFFSEEFFVEPEDKGNWDFNVTYYGNNSPNKTPSYLKITTYSNYNTDAETKTIKVLRLDTENVEQVATKLMKT